MIAAGRDFYFELDIEEIVSSEILTRIFEAIIAASLKQTFVLSPEPLLEI